MKRRTVAATMAMKAVTQLTLMATTGVHRFVSKAPKRDGKTKKGERTVAGPGALGVHVAGVYAAGVRYGVDGGEGRGALESRG